MPIPALHPVPKLVHHLRLFLVEFLFPLFLLLAPQGERGTQTSQDAHRLVLRLELLFCGELPTEADLSPDCFKIRHRSRPREGGRSALAALCPLHTISHSLGAAAALTHPIFSCLQAKNKLSRPRTKFTLGGSTLSPLVSFQRAPQTLLFRLQHAAFLLLVCHPLHPLELPTITPSTHILFFSSEKKTSRHRRSTDPNSSKSSICPTLTSRHRRSTNPSNAQLFCFESRR